MIQKRTQAERTELSDRKMLEAAKQLFIERGIKKTTLKDIGERAGYSRGLASARFGSKEGLFLQLVDQHRQQWERYLNEFVGDKTGQEAVLARVDAIDALIQREPEDVRAVYTLWFESASDQSALRGELEDFNRVARTRVEEVVAKGIEVGEISDKLDPKSFSMVYLSQCFGLIYQWLVSPEDIDLKKAFSRLKDYFRFVFSSYH